MLISMYGAAQAAPAGGGAGGDWWTWLGSFIPVAILGLGVITYLVKKLDASQAENKDLSERLIAHHEVQAPLLKEAIDLIGQQGDVIAQQGDVLAEATIELRRLREERDRERRP